MDRTRALLVASLAALLPLAVSAENYRVAVEPSYPPDQALEVYTPLLDYLGKQTGHTFELVSVRNYTSTGATCANRSRSILSSKKRTSPTTGSTARNTSRWRASRKTPSTC
jgi:hypothetical protein